jgi:hypothetical protein
MGADIFNFNTTTFGTLAANWSVKNMTPGMTTWGMSLNVSTTHSKQTINSNKYLILIRLYKLLYMLC